MEVAAARPSELPIVTLVDDDAHVREAMENLLCSVGIDTISFASAREVIEATLPDRPGCFVLDVRMPGLSGLDLQGHLLKQGNHTPIIFLTAHGDIAMSVEAMKAGARDFLTKPVRDQTFLDAVSRAINADLARREVEYSSRKHVTLYESLTARERQVFRLVVEGSLNKQIGFELGISEVTVKLHRSNMMKKMQATTFNSLFNAWQALPLNIRENEE
ncbi:response regulator transcription factor (plasmid) [Aliirhizobium terrae]|uniref:response regulator transcription factor n=1 Tax=Terrirhizobium terrae TaxID=2926709 RepID=UPI0025768C93|nr:response regulator transcription factor [Rhizobium sp. CC-CFT758]WJH37978.1 response regulator transcription factor [Rhizobium sp. CC-CFT758]